MAKEVICNEDSRVDLLHKNPNISAVLKVYFMGVIEIFERFASIKKRVEYEKIPLLWDMLKNVKVPKKKGRAVNPLKIDLTVEEVKLNYTRSICHA